MRPRDGDPAGADGKGRRGRGARPGERSGRDDPGWLAGLDGRGGAGAEPGPARPESRTRDSVGRQSPLRAGSRPAEPVADAPPRPRSRPGVAPDGSGGVRGEASPVRGDAPAAPRPVPARPGVAWQEFATGETTRIARVDDDEPDAPGRPRRRRGADGPAPSGDDRPGRGRARAGGDGEPAGRPDPVTGSGGSVVTAGRRAELRRQLRQVRRLRILTLVVVTLVIVGAVPLVFAIRAATRDPVFTNLDGLALPEWAATSHQDKARGSRWCIGECRMRERTWESSRGPRETNDVYREALRDAGWRPWSAPGCPGAVGDSLGSCWQFDEYVLALWVGTPPCDPWATRLTGDPAAPAGAPPSGEATGAAPVASGCPGARVMAKVYERVAFRPLAG